MGAKALYGEIGMKMRNENVVNDQRYGKRMVNNQLVNNLLN